MKKVIFLILLSLGASAWATTGSTNPNEFKYPVDWCVNYGCTSQALGTPQTWFSNTGGKTGMVGLISSQNMQNLQQDFSWLGNFPAGMGLIYNGVSTLGNTPGPILVSFDQLVDGVGAYIQADWFGSFTATILLYDPSFNLLGSYSAAGTSNGLVGTGLFIGAYDVSADIAYAIFDTTANGFHDEDFAIGTLLINHQVIPEPSTLLLLGPSLLGLAGMLRRSLNKEVR